MGDICEKPQYGYTASATRDPVGPRFLRITDLRQGTLDWSSVPYAECSEIERGKFALRTGDLVVARIGATTGRSSVIIDPPEAIFASYLIRLRPRDAVNPFFLFFFTRSRPYWKWIDGNKDNNLKGGVNASLLAEIKVPLPPKPEQEKIAAILWKLQSAIEVEDKLIATTRELKQSAMRQLFTRGLRGEPQKDTEIGPIPSSWTISRLETCCLVVSSSISYTDFAQIPEYDGADSVIAVGIKVSDMNLPGNEVFITKANIKKQVPRALAERKLVPPDTVVFPKRGAAIATNKKRLTTDWTVLDPNIIGVRAGSTVHSGFLFQWFQQFDLRTITEAGPTPQLNKKNLTPLLFPRPSEPEEQREIVTILQTLDRKISLHKRKRATLSDLFQTLLHQLMTAQIRVPDLEIDTREISHT